MGRETGGPEAEKTTMVALLTNRLAYLGTSFALFLIALPLISIGSTGGPRFLLSILAAQSAGGAIGNAIAPPTW